MRVVIVVMIPNLSRLSSLTKPIGEFVILTEEEAQYGDDLGNKLFPNVDPQLPVQRGAPVATSRAPPPHAARDAVLSDLNMLGEILTATGRGSTNTLSEVCATVLRYCTSRQCDDELFQTVARKMEIPIHKPETVKGQKLSWREWVKVWCIHAREPDLAFRHFFADFPTGLDPLASVKWMYEHNIFLDSEDSQQTQKRIVKEAASGMHMHVVEYMHPHVKGFMDATSWDTAIYEAAMFVMKNKVITDNDMMNLKRLIDIRDEAAGEQDIKVQTSLMHALGSVLARRFHLDTLQWWHREKERRPYYDVYDIVTPLVTSLVKDPSAKMLLWLGENDPSISNYTWYRAWVEALEATNGTAISYLREHKIPNILAIGDSTVSESLS